ncbi:MAG: Uncharacterized protein AUREO_021070 [Aureobasidium pullulans]|nr:MAG: Uncharacterized protein AUREO_021070 [Aureobasidium pullulans]THY60745.1 hypothetical protein D6C99_01463 [Aureobasidium pullulans]
MASTTPYPPSRSHPSTRISSEDALSSLSTFIASSESTPWLHPDARITPDEIKYSTNGGPQGGIIMHHLRRIEKGLNGEILAPEPDDIFGLPEGDDANLDTLSAGYQTSLDGGLKKGALKKFEDEGEDPETYARNQDILEGDVGERDTSHAFASYDADAMDVDDDAYAGTGGLSKAEREARKEAKKNKKKAIAREKAEKGRAED